jgi:diadenosine tetraphosphate (Ap4A) HIT family hydrolase
MTMEWNSFYGEDVSTSCIGCSLVNGEVDASKFLLGCSENFTIGQDTEVPIPGFIVIGAKEHVNDISMFSEAQFAELMILVQKIIGVLKEKLGIESFDCFYKEKHTSHFHFCIFPRYEWMKEHGKGLSSIEPIYAYAIENMKTEENLQEIRRVLDLIKDEISEYIN